MNRQISSNNTVTLIFAGMLFLLPGFLLGINGLLIPYLQKTLSLSNTNSYLVLTATFSAFVLLRRPSGLLIKRLGYKKGIVISFVVFAIGLLLFVPSAKYLSLPLFLLASFISSAANTLGLANPEQYTMHTVIATSLGFIVGIIVIPRYVSQLLALKIGSISGLIISILIVQLPTEITIHFVSLMGFVISLVWGAVWPLAISNLGRFTKTGASLLVMAIVGGAILPLCFGWLKDALGDIQQAYWIFVPGLLFIVFYAFKGYQIGLNDKFRRDNRI